MNKEIKFAVFGLIGVVSLVCLWIFWPLRIVEAGHKGVVILFGQVNPTVLDEGIHLVNPLARVREIDVRVQKAEAQGDAASKDLQQVTTHIALNYHLNPISVAALYQTIGMDYENTIITPAVLETFKAVTARFTAEELINKREDVRSQIKTALHARLAALTKNGVLVDDFSITNFNFSQTFNRAIESKQEAEQLALKAKRDLDRIRVEAEQKVAQAQAEAAALKAQKQEVTPELIKLREIEAQREAIKKWNGQLPNVNGGVLPFINVAK